VVHAIRFTLASVLRTRRFFVLRAESLAAVVEISITIIEFRYGNSAASSDCCTARFNSRDRCCSRDVRMPRRVGIRPDCLRLVRPSRKTPSDSPPRCVPRHSSTVDVGQTGNTSTAEERYAPARGRTPGGSTDDERTPDEEQHPRGRWENCEAGDLYAPTARARTPSLRESDEPG
jgi:hypothetical protein